MKTLDRSKVSQPESRDRVAQEARDCYKSRLEWRNELLYVFPAVSLGTIAICIGWAVLNPVMNGEPANPFATPQNLLPEWYLYPVYQLVRNFPNKALGIVVMGLASIGLLLIPFIENANKLHYRFRRMISITIFLASLWATLWLGIGATRPVEDAFTLSLF
jgi:cytochrome b6-f complex subunit 4